MSTQLRGSRPNQERRNARERSRVHQVNHGFDLLRTRVPKAVINKKLSKADTLREAVRYIQYLKSLLHTEEGMNQTGDPVHSMYSSTSAPQSENTGKSLFFQLRPNQPLTPIYSIIYILPYPFAFRWSSVRMMVP
ncbi:unnamed protein product [Heligmosomoides polygyrus]|uniref:BHLH domain-containing protein n=1 Tax=Heligmosomoides polygyrus TaxID=6339 RepID=A0A183FZ80_HELPZ|nr:unnamed protein product [Heligmosomoides polygyrus]